MVALTCTILFVQTTMGHAAGRGSSGHPRQPPPRPPRPGESAAAVVREIPGVDAVTEVLHTSVRVGLDKYAAQAVTADGLGETLDLGVVAGDIGDLDDTSVAVSRTAAERAQRLGGRSALA